MRSDRDLSPAHHPLFRLLALNALGGTAVAVLVVAGLIGFNIGGLGTLIARSSDPVLPVGLMTFGFVVTLASAAMGTAVMRLGSDDRTAGGGRALVPIPVRAARRR